MSTLSKLNYTLNSNGNNIIILYIVKHINISYKLNDINLKLY